MFNLTEIMQAAQGGQGIQNLASQFGLSPDQAEAAVKSLMPGLSMGLQNKASSTDGLGSLFEMMTGSQHSDAFEMPEAAAAPETASAGADVLGNLFGSDHAQQAVAQHAAAMSGMSSSLLQSMMPVIASMVLGGLFKGASNGGLGSLLGGAGGGLGGMLGQMMGGGASSAGGLGGLLGQMMQPQAAQGQGGMGGLLGQLMGGLMGGRQAAAPPPAPNPMQAGLEMFQSMLNHGQQVHETHTNALENIFSSLVKR